MVCILLHMMPTFMEDKDRIWCEFYWHHSNKLLFKNTMVEPNLEEQLDTFSERNN